MIRSAKLNSSLTETFSERLKDDRPYRYRYMRLDPDRCWRAAETLIRCNTLTLASPADFNDPFDPAPLLSLEGSKDDLKTYFRGVTRRQGIPRKAAQQFERNAFENWRDPKQRKQVEKAMAKDMTEEFHKLGIYCLSEECDHMLMWSHYADNHRGIVVRFQVDPPGFESFAASALPVTYQKGRPVIRPLTDDGETRYRKALLTKADFWSYELEWRLIRTDRSAGPLPIQEGTIDGVYLGARCPEDHQNAILQWVKNAKAPIALFQGYPDERMFRLTFHQVFP